MKNKDNSKDLLKATSIIGSSKIFTIFLGIFQTKIVSVLLGPVGVGLLGLYKSNIELIRSLTGMGLSFSAVKMIAAADNDENLIAKKIIVLRRWVIFTGLLGVFVTIIFSKQLSIYTFGDRTKTVPIIVSSFAILFMSISDGQLALLQGKRLIKDMAKISIKFSLFNLMITAPIYYYFGEKGIVLVIVATPFFSMFIAWFRIKKIEVKKIKVSLVDTFFSGKQMIKLGFFIVVNGFMANFCMYLVRVYIGKKIGVLSVGLIQAGWTLSNMYVSIILNAMLADFFPRLSKLSNDNNETNSLINQQLKIALILGTPFVIFMLGFSKFIVELLYSKEFLSGVPLIEFLFINVFLTLIIWPLGVLFLARDKGIVCIITDTVWNIIMLILIYRGVTKLGIDIVGISFCIATLIKLFITLKITKKISEYEISSENILLIFSYGMIILFTFINIKVITNYLKEIISVFFFLCSLAISLYELNKIFGFKNLLKK